MHERRRQDLEQPLRVVLSGGAQQVLQLAPVDLRGVAVWVRWGGGVW